MAQVDARNPKTWKTPKRVYHTLIPSAFAFTITIASSVYVPAIPQIQQHFHVSTTVALLPYTFYVLGQGLGPVLAAPMSETFGRRLTYAPYMFLFSLFTLGAGFSNSIASMTVCRFFAGVFGSPVLSVSGGTVADLWHPHERTVPMAIIVLIPFLAPSLGPLIGGYIIAAKGWRWSQWFLLFLATASGIAALAMKETHPRILAEKQRSSGSESEKPSFSAKLRLLLTSTLFRPWIMFFTEAIVGTFAFYIGVSFAIYYCLFAALPYVFATHYHFRLQAQGLVFLGLATGNVLALVFILGLAWAARKAASQAAQSGKSIVVPPERRLVPALIGSPLVPVGLFWYGWSAQANVHWMVPIVGTSLFAFGNFLVFMSYATYVIDVYGSATGASATATVAMLRSLLGSVFPLFTIQMYKRLGAGWASSLLGFLVLALAPVPWVLHRYGQTIRKRSKFAEKL